MPVQCTVAVLVRPLCSVLLCCHMYMMVLLAAVCWNFLSATVYLRGLVNTVTD